MKNISKINSHSFKIELKNILLLFFLFEFFYYQRKKIIKIFLFPHEILKILVTQMKF